MWDGFSTRPWPRSGRPTGGGRVENPSHIDVAVALQPNGKRMSFRSLQIISILLLASALHAETLRLSLDDAVRMALGKGTQTALARSAEERARIARTEALSGLLPQADARLLRYSQSINLATFGFTIPGQPPVVGPFNVIDGQIAAAMQLFNLAAIRHYQSVQQGV